MRDSPKAKIWRSNQWEDFSIEATSQIRYEPRCATKHDAKGVNVSSPGCQHQRLPRVKELTALTQTLTQESTSSPTLEWKAATCHSQLHLLLQNILWMYTIISLDPKVFIDEVHPDTNICQIFHVQPPNLREFSQIPPSRSWTSASSSRR